MIGVDGGGTTGEFGCGVGHGGKTGGNCNLRDRHGAIITALLNNLSDGVKRKRSNTPWDSGEDSGEVNGKGLRM